VAEGRTLRVPVFALAAAELGILLGPAPVRVAAGLVLGFLPGLAITRAVQARMRLEGTERLLLVPGLSLSVAIVTGLVLNGAGIPLTAVSWAIALGLVTAAGLVAGALLEDEHEPGRHPRPPAPSPGGRRRLGIGAAALFAMAALSLSAAVAIGVIGQRDQDNQIEFTELWALQEPGLASAVRVGVRSHERGDVRYRVRVSIAGRVVRTEPLTLRPGETWQSTQPVARPGQRVDVALLTSPRGAIYREVRLTAG
jgi:uncharacterized membrane protein